MRIVLVGEESAGVKVLEALRAAPEAPEVIGAVTTTESNGLRRPVVAAAASRLGVEVRPISEVRSNSFTRWIQQREIDLLLNVHSLSVLGDDTVAAPRIGSFNLHPGPLPEYAGLNAPSWAIYEGRTSHGVTLHWMDPGIDTGPIAYSTSFEIDDSDTGLSLTSKAVRHGVPLVLRLIGDASHDAASVPMLEQDLGKRRYFGREVPNDGAIIWSAPAHEVVRFVRAADYFPFSSPWGVPRAELRGHVVGIAKAALTGEPTGQAPGTVTLGESLGSIRVAAADEWVVVERMRWDGEYVRPSEICSAGDRLGDGG